MKISRNNYESWFIDYSDGTLTAEQRAELLLFLEQHPDLKAEFENFVNELLPLQSMPESLPETFSASLKRGDITESNLSYYLIASMEGDLNAQEQNILDTFLQKNPTAAKQQSLVALTRLQPVEEIYPAKAQLKKPVPMVFSFTRTVKYAVAAMLLLTVVAGSYVIYTKTVSTNEVQYAGPSIRDRKAERFSVPTQGPEQLAVEQLAVEQLAVEQLAVGGSAVGGSAVGGSAVGGSAVGGRKEHSPEGADVKPVRRNRLSTPMEQKQDVLQVAEQRPAEQSPSVPQEQPVVQEPLAQHTPIPVTTSSPSASAPVTSSPAPAGEEYVSVWDAIRGGAEKKVNEFAGSETDAPATATNRTNRSRLIDLVGKGVQKLSKEKIQYNTTYDENGNLSALNVSSGKFGIKRGE